MKQSLRRFTRLFSTCGAITLLTTACQDHQPTAVDRLSPLHSLGADTSTTTASGTAASFSVGTATGMQPSFSLSASLSGTSSASVVRIYKDHDAWSSGGGRDEKSLVALGKVKGQDFFVHPVADLQKGIPGGTEVVLITANSWGSASTSANQRDPAAQAALSQFLAAGGTVLVDMADNEGSNGYIAPGATGTPSYVFPTGDCKDATLTGGALGADGILGTADDHPFVKGPDGIAGTSDDMDDSKIDMWTSCWVVHGNLADGITLPADARVLATADFSGAKPILAEYCHEGGRVVLNTLTLGFVGHKPGGDYSVRESYTQMSLFTYALSSAVKCSPEAQLEGVIRDLKAIEAANPGTAVADKVEDARAKAEVALYELQKSPADRQAAAGNIEGAVGDLEAAVSSGLLDASTGKDLMDRLARVNRQLATTAIDAAIARGADPVKIEEAKKFVAEGDSFRSSGQYKDAAAKYKAALSTAEGA